MGGKQDDHTAVTIVPPYYIEECRIYTERNRQKDRKTLFLQFHEIG